MLCNKPPIIQNVQLGSSLKILCLLAFSQHNCILHWIMTLPSNNSLAIVIEKSTWCLLSTYLAKKKNHSYSYSLSCYHHHYSKSFSILHIPVSFFLLFTIYMNSLLFSWPPTVSFFFPLTIYMNSLPFLDLLQYNFFCLRPIWMLTINQNLDYEDHPIWPQVVSSSHLRLLYHVICRDRHWAPASRQQISFLFTMSNPKLNNYNYKSWSGNI